MTNTDASTRPYHHGNLRQAVLAAALDVLRREGPSAVSLRDLARTVGVRHTSLYTHFRDRSHLLAVIAAEGFATLLAAMEATPRSPRRRVVDLAETYVGFAKAHPAYYRVMFLPEASRPESRVGLEEACDACFDRLTEALRENGDLTDGEIVERAVGVWSTLHGLVSLGDDAGPLYGRISREDLIPIAARIADALAVDPSDTRLQRRP